MTILIVDDETVQCRWLASIIEELHPEYRIHCALNGEEALTLLAQEHVDILFTDICMPLLDGLKLSQRVQREYPDTIIAFITSHQSFEYAAEGIRLGVADYILKPFDRESIRQTLQTFVNRLAPDRSLVDKQGLPTLLGQDALRGWLLGRAHDPQALSQLLSPGPFYTLAEIQGDRRLTQNELAALACSIEPEASALNLTFRLSYLLDRLLLFTGGPECGAPVALYERILSRLTQMGVARAAIAYAAPMQGLSQPIVPRFRQLRETMSYRFYLKEPRLLPPELSHAEPPRLPSTFRDQLTAAVLEGPEAAESYLKSLFDLATREGHWGNPADLLSTLNVWVSEALQSMNTYFSEDSLREMRQMHMSCFRQTESAQSLQTNLTALLYRMCAEVERFRDNHHKQLIDRALTYIHENYEKPLSLEEIAGRTFLSPAYFSTLFRQITGTTFVKYLSDYRMTKSTELLRGTKMQIQEISQRVGYPDTRYFARIFHRRFGCTPNEYRYRSTEKGNPQ